MYTIRREIEEKLAAKLKKAIYNSPTIPTKEEQYRLIDKIVQESNKKNPCREVQ